MERARRRVAHDARQGDLVVMFEAFFAVLPVFLVIFLGSWLHDRDVLPEQTGNMLGLMVLRLSLPALILHILAGAKASDLAYPAFWTGMFGASVIIYFIGYWFDKLLCRRGEGPATIVALGCSSCNAAFVGLPIVANLFPGNDEAMLIAGLATLTPNAVMILAQSRLDLLAGETAWNGRKGGARFWHLCRALLLGNPVLLMSGVGLILSLTGIGLWGPLDRVAELIGNTAAPCMLLSLGFDLRQKLALAARRGQGHAFLRQAWVLLCKLILLPLLSWGIMAYIGLPPLWTAIGVLISATGSALIASVLAAVYSAIAEEAALTAVLSNGLSLFTLTGFIWLFRHLGYF